MCVYYCLACMRQVSVPRSLDLGTLKLTSEAPKTVTTDLVSV